MKRAIVAVALTVAVGLPAIPASATPPPPPRGSTDCAARVYVIDDLVCSTPTLLALDRQVAEAAAATPDATRPEHPRMIDGQNDWYWRSRQCWKRPARQQAACLTAAYVERLAVLAVLRAPPAPGQGQAGHCKGPPWGNRAVRLNRVGALFVVSDPGGEVLAVAPPRNRHGWTAYLTILRDKAPWPLRHHQGGMIIECRRG